MQQLKEWYSGLDNNEQKMVQIASVFFGLVILIFGLLKPLSQSVTDLQTQVKSRQKSVDHWKQSMPLLLANRGQAAGGSSSMPLNTVITSTARKFNLNVSRVQEKGSDEIQVWFDNISFNDFLRWTAEIQNKHRVKVSSANIRSKDRDGLSSIDVKIIKG